MLHNRLVVLLLLLTAATTSFALACGDDALPSTPTSSTNSEGIFKPRFGVVGKFSMLGAGGDVGVSLTSLANVRVGANALSFSHSFQSNGIKYDGTLHYRSVEAIVDITPFHDWFHISPGMLFYNDNNITANATVPGGQNFDLGSVSFRSSAGSRYLRRGLSGSGGRTVRVIEGSAVATGLGCGSMVSDCMEGST